MNSVIQQAIIQRLSPDAVNLRQYYSGMKRQNKRKT